MSATLTTLDQLDCDISVAAVALDAARRAFDRCPSAENAHGVDEAQGCVDRLLDERFAARC